MDSQENWQRDWQRRRHNGRMTLGIILTVVGAIFLLRIFGLFPPFFFTFHSGWPLILVVIGIIIGIKSNFRRNAWWILILIGGTHMLLPYYPYIGDVPTRQILWPSLLILAGIVIILRRKDDHWDRRWQRGRHTQLVT